MGVLLVFGAPHKHRLLVGREHGRTIPLAELAPLIPARVRPMRCAKPLRASRDGSGSVRRHEANSLHRLFLPLKNMPTPLTPHA
jgi:hypothetical protein